MGKPRDIPLTFSGPGSRPMQIAGRYLRVLETPSAPIFIALDGGSELERGAGQAINDPDGFQRIEVRSTVAQTVVLSVSDVPQDDNRTNLALSVAATVSGATAVTALPVVTVPAGGNVKIADANPDRKELRVAIASSEPGPVFLGESGIGAGEGGMLEPGMVDYLATTAEVWAYNPGASAVDVSVMDMESP